MFTQSFIETSLSKSAYVKVKPFYTERDLCIRTLEQQTLSYQPLGCDCDMNHSYRDAIHCLLTLNSPSGVDGTCFRSSCQGIFRREVTPNANNSGHGI